jgi:hypothetical protein
VFLANTQATLLGVAAIVSALGGLVTTIFAVRKSRREATEDCEKRLKASRKEAEDLAEELHRIKMEHFE